YGKVTNKICNLTPFGGIFFVLDMFDKHLGWLIDHKLGKRSQFRGFQYSEIFRAMFSICFCGGLDVHGMQAYNAQDPTNTLSLTIYAREYFARVKMFLDIMTGKQPTTLARSASSHS
ncbi:MAG: hypothetical protein KBT13_05190, partial [Bacteroidales bacterium]|nr:hypothetical protein [Candidatus Sodaliphilus limicaballi]